MATAPAIPQPNVGWDSRILAFQVERLVTVYGVVTTRYVVLIDTLFSPSALRERQETSSRSRFEIGTGVRGRIV